MRNSIFAMAAMFLVAGCGDPAPMDNPHPDLKTASGDMTMASVDMAKPGPGCFAIIGGASSTKSPASSKMKAQAFLDCVDAVCGAQGVVDGGNAAKPCTTLSDGGPSAACDTCFSNVQVNTMINFTDANGKAITCKPDTTAPDCKACGTQIVACVLDCNSDTDCMGLTIGGVAATCIDNTCQ